MIWNEGLFEQLANRNWVYSDTLLDTSTATQWRQVFHEQQRKNQFRDAQIADQSLNQKIRSDQIHWLDKTNSQEASILHSLDEGRKLAAQTLRISIPCLEAHFAHYSAGQFYKRHCDQPKGKSSRILTFVIYLHEHWEPGLGGELIITDGDTIRVLEVIEPKPKRVVIFKSDEVWHEVQKSNFDRYSLTGWFRNEFNSFPGG